MDKKITTLPFNQMPQTNKLNQTLSGGEQGRDRKLLKACKDFEAIFISHLYKSMRGEPDQNALFGKGLGGEMFQDLFDTEMAQKMASGKGIGLSERLYNSFNLEGIPLPAENPSSRAAEVTGSSFSRIQQYDSIIQDAAREYNVDPALVYAVIQKESDGVSTVVSSKGAKGLMQLMDGTADDLGVKNSMDPADNITGGVRYLSQMLQRFDGNKELALAAYNAGPGNVQKYGGIPPFKETQQYVKKVLESYGHYKFKLSGTKQAIV